MSIRCLRSAGLLRHNQLLRFSSNGQPVEMSHLGFADTAPTPQNQPAPGTHFLPRHSPNVSSPVETVIPSQPVIPSEARDLGFADTAPTPQNEPAPGTQFLPRRSPSLERPIPSVKVE